MVRFTTEISNIEIPALFNRIQIFEIIMVTIIISYIFCAFQHLRILLSNIL